MSSQFTFDPNEYADVPDDAPQQEEAVDEVVAGLEQSPTPMSLDALDLEVEKRFEVAMYYRLLLKDSLFSDNSEASQIVEHEVREFIRERLEILMGLKTPKPQVVAESPFSGEEVEALKTIAGRVIKNAKGLLGEKTAPSLRKTQVPVAAPQPPPKPAPAVKKRGPVVKPGVAQAKPQQPAAKPQPKQPKAPPKVIQTTPKPKTEDSVVEDLGQIIEEDGKKFRLVKNEFGTVFKQDITGQVRPAGYTPLTGQALDVITQQKAITQVNKLDNMAIHAAAGAIAGLVGGSGGDE